MPPVTRRELALLAAPAAASALLNNAYRVIDQYAVQWLGVPAQAAVGSCTFVLIAIYAVHALLSGGVGPLVARATGAGDDALRRRALGNALVGSAVVAAALAVAGGLGADAVVAAVGLTGEAGDLAATYLRWLTVLGLPLALQPVLDAALVAMGRTGLVMGLQIVATVLNLALNPLFIYTLDMGIAGAAVATVLSRSVSVTGGLLALRALTGLRARGLTMDRTMLRITRVGAPVMMGVLAYAVVYGALLRFAVAPLGAVTLAALGIGFSALEGFTWPVFHGISLGVSSVVGRRIGAGQLTEAARAVRLALPLSLVAGLTAALVFWIGAAPLSDLFTDDPAVLAAAVLYARILAWSQVFVALEALSEGVLTGAGDTRTAFWWSAPWNALRVPLGWALALPFGWGAVGVWWAINATTVVKAAGKGFAVARGRWLSVEV